MAGFRCKGFISTVGTTFGFLPTTITPNNILDLALILLSRREKLIT